MHWNKIAQRCVKEMIRMCVCVCVDGNLAVFARLHNQLLGLFCCAMQTYHATNRFIVVIEIE